MVERTLFEKTLIVIAGLVGLVGGLIIGYCILILMGVVP